MSLSTNVQINTNRLPLDADLISKVYLNNDLGKLSPSDKVKYLSKVCDSVGLNPVTRPIQLINFQGKEIPYCTKDATEQLRKLNKVSITNIESKILNESVYVVTATATTPDNRQDSSTGVVSILGLKGDALGNAMMKAETKAKRRVTLSICGLGFMDESELDTMPTAKRVDLNDTYNNLSSNNNKLELKDKDRNEDDQCKEYTESPMDEHLREIQACKTSSQLQQIFTSHYKFWTKAKSKEGVEKIILAKDKRKDELIVEEFNAELTGEVIENELA